MFIVKLSDIYQHPIEGVCIYAGAYENRHTFLSVGINSKHKTKSEKPRLFSLAKGCESELTKPTIPLLIQQDKFSFCSVVFFIKDARVDWGYMNQPMKGGFLSLMVEEKHKKIHKDLCFQVNCIDGKSSEIYRLVDSVESIEKQAIA